MQRSLLVRRALVSFGLIVLITGVALLIRGQLASRKTPPAKAAEIDIRTAVRVTSAKRQTYREELIGYGKSKALRRTAVAAEVAGLVIRISDQLNAGVSVNGGDELVWLDDRDSRNRLVSIDAQLSRNTAEAESLSVDAANVNRQLVLATEELGVAERELKRVSTLVQRGVATSSAEDAERLRVTQRQAAILRMQGELERNRTQGAINVASRRVLSASRAHATTDLARCVVRAPYAGQIEFRTVQPGARVAPGSVLFALVDRTRIEIPIPLPASRYGDVVPGAAARITIPGREDHAWLGKVARIAPTVSTQDRTFFVYIECVGDATVPPGSFVVVSIDGREHRDVFVIPRTAFVDGSVFIAKDGVAHRRTPEVARSLPSIVLCSGGIESGEQIILTNLEEVAEGARVQTRDDG